MGQAIHVLIVETGQPALKDFGFPASLDLGETEIVQLVAFLESLSSEPTTVETPVLPDYQVMPLGTGATQ